MELLREASQETSQDLLVEVLGTLANMTVYDLPASSTWAKLLKEHGLMSLFSRMLVPGMVANDLLLEMIMLIASIASDTQVERSTDAHVPNMTLMCISPSCAGGGGDCIKLADRPAVPGVARQARGCGDPAAAPAPFSQVRGWAIPYEILRISSARSRVHIIIPPFAC